MRSNAVKAGIAALTWLGMVCAAGCGGGSSAAAQNNFSLASLSGSYAGEFSGQISTSSGLLPFIGTGIFVADGAGHLSGHETYTVDSMLCQATLLGTYTVNPDGSGTNQVTFTSTTPGCSSGTYTQGFAIGGSNQLVLLTNTNADQITEAWHLQ